jgi:uncharacterized protein with beta-barrel porin domain
MGRKWCWGFIFCLGALLMLGGVASSLDSNGEWRYDSTESGDELQAINTSTGHVSIYGGADVTFKEAVNITAPSTDYDHQGGLWIGDVPFAEIAGESKATFEKSVSATNNGIIIGNSDVTFDDTVSATYLGVGGSSDVTLNGSLTLSSGGLEISNVNYVNGNYATLNANAAPKTTFNGAIDATYLSISGIDSRLSSVNIFKEAIDLTRDIALTGLGETEETIYKDRKIALIIAGGNNTFDKTVQVGTGGNQKNAIFANSTSIFNGDLKVGDIQIGYSDSIKLLESEINAPSGFYNRQTGRVIFNGVGNTANNIDIMENGILEFGNGSSLSMTNINVANRGSLDLAGNATATGDFTFMRGGMFTPNGNHLDVTGAVTVNDGASIILNEIDVGKIVLSGSNGISNLFDSLFYETALINGNKDLQVTGSSSVGNIVADLANSGVTIGKNGANGIGMINTIIKNATGELRNLLYTELIAIRDMADNGDKEAASIALQQLIGEYSTRAVEATHSIAQNFNGAVFGHLSQMRDARAATGSTMRSGGALASLGSGEGSLANRIWAGGFGAFTRQGNDNGDYGYDYDAGGFILGYDHHFGKNITVGVTGAYSHGRVEGNEGYSQTDIDTMNLGLYASYDPQGGFYAEGNLGLGFTWNDESEELFGDRYRNGEYDTTSFQVGGNVGYAFLLPSAFRVIPTVGMQFIHVNQDDYQQTGNGLPMWRDSVSANYLEIPFAMRVNKTFDLGDGISLTPELRAAWILEAKKDDVTVRTGYVGSGESVMLLGANTGRNRGLIGAGMKARFNNSVDAFVDYNLEFRNKYLNHNIMAGMGLSF